MFVAAPKAAELVLRVFLPDTADIVEDGDVVGTVEEATGEYMRGGNGAVVIIDPYTMGRQLVTTLQFAQSKLIA